MRTRWMILAPLACALAIAAVRAQQPSFRVSTELVVVDVSVVDKNGTPMKGLEPTDFTVSIDGQPRAVRSVTFVDESRREGTAPVRYSSNEAAMSGRLILIVVDEASIAFGGLRAAVESIDHLLAGAGPADRIGLAALPGPRMLVFFTADHSRIAQAIKTITGGSGPSTMLSEVEITPGEAFAIDAGDTTVFDDAFTRECGRISDALAVQACRTAITTEAHRLTAEERNRVAQFVAGLQGLLRALADIEGPKVVVVFSEGFASPEATSQMIACAQPAAAARAVIYAMRLDRSMFEASSRRTVFSISTFADERQNAIAALDALAGSARGTAFEIIGSADTPFKRLATEMSGYYLVGVEPATTDRDGRPHQIRVTVGRAGATARARREFVWKARVTDEKKLLSAALESPLPVTDLPLRVATFNMPDEDPTKVRVLVVAEVDRAQGKNGNALVGVTFTSESGKTTGSVSQHVNLPRSESGSLSLTLSTALPPATYTMKLAAVREGQAGSVEHRVVARLTTGDPAGKARPAVQAGELVVASPSVGQVVPRLDAVVSGDRFVSFASIALDARSKARHSFVFDVAKEEAGPVLISTPGALQPASKSRTRIVEATIDARMLPPGAYVVRLNVSADNGPVATVSTPFSLKRPRRGASAGATPGDVAGPPPDAVAFKRESVLEPGVLGPFLEEVARFAPATSRPALELARTGRLDEALRRAPSGNAGDPTTPFLRGLSLFAAGSLQEASNAFREAIAASPDLLVGAFYIGACYAAGRKDGQAINAWQTSLVALRRYPAVYRFMADAMIRNGELERARALLTEAARRWPDDEDLRRRAASAAVETGQYEQALEYADRILAERPTDTTVLFLAMRSVFHALLEGNDLPQDDLRARLKRYRDLYVAAGGLQQALVDEWVRFAEAREPG